MLKQEIQSFKNKLKTQEEFIHVRAFEVDKKKH